MKPDELSEEKRKELLDKFFKICHGLSMLGTLFDLDPEFERQVRKCLENCKSGIVETVTSPLNKNIINAASTVGNTQENLRKWKQRSSRKSRE